MAKYKPGQLPKTSAERWWYAQGYNEGLKGRAIEIQHNQDRVDKAWSEVRTAQARLKGTMQLTRSLHDLIEVALGDKY